MGAESIPLLPSCSDLRLTSFRFLSQVPLLTPTFFLFIMIVITLTNIKIFMDTVLRESGTTIVVT